MGQIDAAMAKNPQLSAAQLAEVKVLRAQGGKLHESGQHGASFETPAKAKKMLGIR